MAGAGKIWKDKLKDVKKQVREDHELITQGFDIRIEEARENGDSDLIRRIQDEQTQTISDRDFQITGKKRKPVIKDPALFEEHKRANFKIRKGVYTWTDGGRQLAREQRVNKKKNMDSPVAAQGSLATVCREISRWEMSYGTEISLKKGSVVMPISDSYVHNEKKCVTVMAGPNIFKGVPVAVLRPVSDDE
jgi:hypothetical protein